MKKIDSCQGFTPIFLVYLTLLAHFSTKKALFPRFHRKKRAYDGWADLSVDSPISANYAFFGALRKISNK